MPDCRKKLTFDKAEESGSVTFGEMCHIVGEKNSATSPRGESKLPLEDRNEYSNLILLCSNCHKIIDKDEKKYTIEILANWKKTAEEESTKKLHGEVHKKAEAPFLEADLIWKNGGRYNQGYSRKNPTEEPKSPNKPD